MVKESKIIYVALFLIITAIILGAFGAHVLKARFSPEILGSFETGVRYQMYHGLGIMLIYILGKVKPGLKISASVICLFLGCLLFSGSIYLLCFNSVWQINSLSFLGPITPIGGLLLITGWIVLWVNVYKYSRD